jgi:hypothetical protein
VAQAYGTATNAGASGIGTANSTTATGVNAMGSPVDYYRLGNQSLGNWGNTLAMGYRNQLQAAQFNNQVRSEHLQWHRQYDPWRYRPRHEIL